MMVMLHMLIPLLMIVMIMLLAFVDVDVVGFMTLWSMLCCCCC